MIGERGFAGRQESSDTCIDDGPATSGLFRHTHARNRIDSRHNAPLFHTDGQHADSSSGTMPWSPARCFCAPAVCGSIMRLGSSLVLALGAVLATAYLGFAQSI